MVGNKSSSSNQFISTPQGGGAVKGIGEKFSPDLHTGTGNFTIPISIPAGRNGFQPQLSLTYSTGNGNSIFGLGWSIGIPNITRKTSKGIPRYRDKSKKIDDWDTFILSGAEDLVPVALWNYDNVAVSDSNSGIGPRQRLKKIDNPTEQDFFQAPIIEFRPRTEGLFAHIYRHRGYGNNYWEVRSKDGMTSVYGTPKSKDDDPCVVADPTNPSNIFSWKLSSTIDAFGNRIEYIYKRYDAVKLDSEGWLNYDSQLYISEIRYIDYYDNNTLPSSISNSPQFLVKIKFNYEERFDKFSEYRSGFEIRTTMRCTRIETYSRGVEITDNGKNTSDSEGYSLIHSYSLKYLDQQQNPFDGSLPLNGISLLQGVKSIGYREGNKEWMAPIELKYSIFEPRKRKFFPITGPNMPSFSLANPNYELIDVIGNGLPDIIEMDGFVTRYWHNQGDGTFSRPKEMKYAPVGIRLSDPVVQLMDTNGDGRVDLLVTGQQNIGINNSSFHEGIASIPSSSSPSDSYTSNSSLSYSKSSFVEGLSGFFSIKFGVGEWDKHSFTRYTFSPSFNLKDPDVRLLDLTGDGIIDAVRSGLSSFECFFNDPTKGGWYATSQVQRKSSLKEFPNVTFSDPRVKLADMTGDGLQDIALIHDGSIVYWPSLGWGNWGKRISMKKSPRFPYGYDPKRVLVGDVDGDGLADIVYIDNNKVTLWINQSGNGWSDPVVIKGTPSIANMDSVRLADMLGCGISGILWSYDASLAKRDNMFFLDFSGGIKPYLLAEVDNNIGSKTRIGYSPSTKFYLDDKKKNARWKTSLPFPVHVVSKVEVIDYISGSKLTTEYTYHHGYWDGVEREFRGFGRTDKRDTQSFAEYNGWGTLEENRPHILDSSKQSFSPIFKTVEEKFFSPPTETRTWFHQGPIGDEYGEWIEASDLSSEFWSIDRQVLERPKYITDFLDSLTGSKRRMKRDALRALRGRIIRTELYALDNTEASKRPYTVTEFLYGVLPLSFMDLAVTASMIIRTANEGSNKVKMVEYLSNTNLLYQLDEASQTIFFPCSLAERTTQWERGNDPMTRFNFTEKFDRYGQPLSQISIAVPRGRDFFVNLEPLSNSDDVEHYLVTYMVTEYAEGDDGSIYIVDRVSKTTTFEIKNNGRTDIFTLKNAIERINNSGNSADIQENNIVTEYILIGQTINFYDGTPFKGLPFAQIGNYGALSRSESLILTDEILQKAYKSEDTSMDPSATTFLLPPYFSHDGSVSWTTDYPQYFRDLMPIKFASDPTRPGLSITTIGYGYPISGPSSKSSVSEFAPGYFAATERRSYDFQIEGSNGLGRGLLLSSRNSLGKDTSITYDRFGFLVTQITDPSGLVIKSINDYAVFQPSTIIDVNGNRTHYTFSPLGVLDGIRVMGKENENVGDTIDAPSTRFEYFFNSFQEKGHLFNWNNLVKENTNSIDNDSINADKKRLIEFLRQNFLIEEETPAEKIHILKHPSNNNILNISIVDDTLAFSIKLTEDLTNAVLAKSIVSNSGNNKDIQVYQFNIIKESDNSSKGITKLNLYGRLQPIFVRTIKRIHHINEIADVPPEEVNDTISTMEYSDGFGRIVQTRTQAEDIIFGNSIFGDSGLSVTQESNTIQDIAVGLQSNRKDFSNVVVSGWQVYDNKGNVVEKYEPFYSVGFAYELPIPEQFGGKLSMYYDPRGQVIRTVNPDASEQLVVHGVPRELSDPLFFSPTPWEAYTYDANDNSGRTHPQSSMKYQNHRNTPSSIIIDALGRKIKSIARNGRDIQNEWYEITYEYDIRGNLKSVMDALGRTASSYVYDLKQKPTAMKTESIDAGLRVNVSDAGGNIIEQRNGKFGIVLTSYDDLSRPTRLWARDKKDEPLTLREVIIFGDDIRNSSMSHEEASRLNILGKIYKHYDEAGLISFETSSNESNSINSKPYDFKGNAVEKSRKVISDSVILKVFDAPSASTDWKNISTFRIDWQPPISENNNELPLSEYANSLLDNRTYRVSLTFNALNHIKKLYYPEDTSGKRKVVQHVYNEAGNLKSLLLNDKFFINNIAYNSKRQQILIAYGNNVMTRYAFDNKTFRLLRMKTEKYNMSRSDSGITFGPSGQNIFQDYAYEYDVIGNILNIHDRSPNSGISNSPIGKDKLDRVFSYDPLYSLISATGREYKYDFLNLSSPWMDDIHTVDVTQCRDYIQQYQYDKAGNIIKLIHKANDGSGGGFSRDLFYDHNSNRLLKLVIGKVSYNYEFDPNGNIVSEANLRHFEWDHRDRLKAFYVNAGNNAFEPSIFVHYLYDSSGQRVKKITRKQGGQIESTVYVDNIFEHNFILKDKEKRDNNTIHVMAGKKRVAVIRVGIPFQMDNTPEIKYKLGDHLGSCDTSIDLEGNLINREEYYPYGETSFGSFAKKRYRFTGMEKDSESGLYYHGARYYSPWLTRWTSCDPLGIKDGLNLYVYSLNDPMNFSDTEGKQALPNPSNTPYRLIGDALGRAVARWGTAELVAGGGGGAATGGGAAGGGALATGGAIAVIGISLAVIGYSAHSIWKANKELNEAKINSEKLQKYVERQIDLAWKNGMITFDEYLGYRITGTLNIERNFSVNDTNSYPSSSGGSSQTNSRMKYTSGIPPTEGARLTTSIRNSLRLKGFEETKSRNIAISESVIDGQRKLLVGVSGKDSPPGTVPVAENPIFETTPSGAMTRAHDSEVKILEELAKDLSPEAKGTIVLYTEREPCRSCSKVIGDFQKKFPNIELKITHGEK